MGDQQHAPGLGATLVTRRRALAAGSVIAGGGLLGTTAFPGWAKPVAASQATPVTGVQPAQPDDLVALAQKIAVDQHLRAVIFQAAVDGEVLVTSAFGESLTGVPATADMHFRNGAVAMSYIATLLLQLVDEGTVGLDDPLATWLPDLPDAAQVTLRMLANMTSGYQDFVQTDRFGAAFYGDPFRIWTPEELIDIGLSTPRVFAPGTNWAYSHTNYVILGLALEAIAGEPLEALLQSYILDPLGLDNTVASQTASIPEPVLHAYSSERRQLLGVDPGVRFYEETTFWNPSWTTARGAVQTSNIDDMTASAIAIGEGTLLSPESHQAQVSGELIGFGTPVEGCRTCRTLNESYAYGLGIVLSGPWLLQNPLFGGYGSIAAYLPGKKIAISVATTFREDSYSADGNGLANRASWEIFAAIAAALAPEDAPSPTRS